MEFETVIGLEVHVELATRTKLFCGCPNLFGGEPNTHVCPVCLGLPGVLPVLNRRAIELHLKAARALGCEIAPRSKFDRKNYFYPDMPKNFQTSQYDLPLAVGGTVTLPEGKQVGITRIHLEEDTGKSVHLKMAGQALVPGRLGGSDVTWVDYNRAGVPLLEIVSEPDMRSPQEAFDYMVILRDVLRWIEVSDCKMEEGSLRCDANVSLRPVGQAELGTKTEIKNMNSFKSVRAALEYEVERQRQVLSEGGTIIQETRGWDEDKGVTISMRTKEEAHDYRYFPEPDLPLLEIDAAWVENVDQSLGELPQARRARYVRELQVSDKDAELLTGDKLTGDFFEKTVAAGQPPKEVAKWMANEVSRLVNDTGIPLQESLLTPENLAGTLALVEQGKVSAKAGQKVVEHLFREGGDPAQLVQSLGLAQISGEDELLPVLKQVVADNPVPVQEYRSGKAKAFNVLVGQTMKRTQGRANPQEVNRLLRGLLDEN